MVFSELSKLPAESRSAREVVQAARDRRSPLHPIVFHTDPGTAAERYYEQRARHVMASVYVRVVREEEVTERPAFYAVTVAPQQVQQQKSYVLYTEATERDDWTDEIMQRARQDLETFVLRHRRYKAIFEEADEEMATLLRSADDYLKNP